MASFRKINLYKSSISVVLVFLMLIYQFLPGFTALAADVAPDQVDRTDWLNPSVVPERKELVNIVNGDLTVYSGNVSGGFSVSNASDTNRRDGSFGWKTRPPKGYTESKQRAYQIEYQMAGKMLNSGFAMTDYKGKNDNTAIYAELNANIPGTLYQEIASIPGETLYYGFYHSVRRNNATDQTIKYTYNTADGIDIYSETGDATDTTTNLNINKMNFYLSGKTKRDEFGTDGYPLNENANNFDENGTMRVRPCWSLRRSTQQSLADDTAQIKRGINYGWQQFLIYDAVAKKNVVHYGYLFDVWDTVKNTGVSYFKVPKTDINGNKWDSTTATEPTTGVNTRDTQAELSALKLAGYVQGSINNATFKESVIGYWDTSFGWKRYFGSYTVPKNQVLTEYAYESSTIRELSYGNYLDGVYFMSGSSLGVEKTFSGRSRAVLPNSIIGAKIEVSNFGAMNATSIKVTDKLSPFTDYVDYIGNVKVMNTTKNTDITTASKINYDVASGVLTVDLPTIRGVRERAENNEMDNGKPVQIGDTIDITFDLKALTEIRNTAFSTAGKYIKNQATVDFRDQDNPLKEEMSLSEMKKVASAVPQMYIIDVFLSKTAKEVTGQKPEYIETDANGNKNQFYEVNLNVLGKVGMYTNNIRLDNPPEWLIWDTLKQNPTVPANTPYVSITQNLTKRTGEAVDINNIRGDDILKMAVTLRNTGSAVATNVTLHELLSPFYEYTNIPGFVYVDNTITAVKPNTNDPKKVKL
ncbi:MAG: hypothetical protein RR436_07015, partial [Clostridia bacterium]